MGNNFICSDMFADRIFAHSLGSFAEHGACPMDDVGENIGSYGKIYFPNGRQKCSVILGAKCGGPTFRVNPFLSIHPEEYEIYWAEWDYSMIDQPSSTLKSTDIKAKEDMNLHDHYPIFTQEFSYEGMGNDLVAGYPGATPLNTELGFVSDYDLMRALDYGLGQASSGMYEIVDQQNYTREGVWKAFGAQGQYLSDHEGDMGYRPINSERCESRYMMVTIVHHSDDYLTDESEVVLDIFVSDLKLSAIYMKATFGVMALLVANIL